MNALGPGMSVTLITTFYGVVLANLVFIPIAKKLKAQTDSESLQKELYMEGLLSIQDGENPRIIKDKLTSRITSYNVCYTKLLRVQIPPDPGAGTDRNLGKIQIDSCHFYDNRSAVGTPGQKFGSRNNFV